MSNIKAHRSGRCGEQPFSVVSRASDKSPLIVIRKPEAAIASQDFAL